MIYSYIIETKNNMDGYSISEFETVWSMWVDVHSRYTQRIIIRILGRVVAWIVNC